MEIPSLAFLSAWFNPLIWADIRLAMDIPAASSLALLMRRPDDSRFMELVRVLVVLFRFLWAFKDVMLLLIEIAMFKFLRELKILFLPASLPAG
jgi:hypothetical protein